MAMSNIVSLPVKFQLSFTRMKASVFVSSVQVEANVSTETKSSNPSSLISQSHCEPSGSLATDKHSIGSTNEAFLGGSESSLLMALRCILCSSAQFSARKLHRWRQLSVPGQ